MKTKIMLVLVVVMCVYVTSAQSKEKSRFRFGSQNYAGILEGENGTSFQLHTVNGIRYHGWFTGVGTGLDYYYERTIPLFLSVNKTLPLQRVPLFVNGDIGVNFPWAKNNVYLFEGTGEYRPSLYWSGGLGYKFRFKQSQRGILLNLGYSYKHLIQENEVTFPCFNPPCPVDKERFDYRLKRVSVKLGVEF